MGERILRVDEVQYRTGLCRTSLWRLERAGKFPRRRAVLGQRMGWLESEVDEWIRQRPVAVVGASVPDDGTASPANA